MPETDQQILLSMGCEVQALDAAEQGCAVYE